MTTTNISLLQKEGLLHSKESFTGKEVVIAASFLAYKKGATNSEEIIEAVSAECTMMLQSEFNIVLEEIEEQNETIFDFAKWNC